MLVSLKSFDRRSSHFWNASNRKWFRYYVADIVVYFEKVRKLVKNGKKSYRLAN